MMKYPKVWPFCLNFRHIIAKFSDIQKFRDFTVNSSLMRMLLLLAKLCLICQQTCLGCKQSKVQWDRHLSSWQLTSMVMLLGHVPRAKSTEL